MPTPASADQIFRAVPDPIRLPAGEGVEIVHAEGAETAIVAGPRRIQALLACQGFATLDRHAARIAAQGWGTPDEIRGELADLARAGLLVSAASLLDRLADASPPEPAPRVVTLGIPTRDRIPELRRALDGHARSAVHHGRGIDLVVGDDAGDPAVAEQTRAAALAIGARHGVAVTYLGREEKARHAARIAEHAGLDRAIVDLALGTGEDTASVTSRLRLTIGQNQNALLLHGAGAPMIQVDDDTLCRIAPVPGQLPGLGLTARGDPSEMWFPAPGAPDLPDRVVVERDFAAIHEGLLGRRVTACAAEARRAGLDLDGATSAIFRRLSRYGGRVACTMTGAAGDSGTGSMWHLLLLDDASRARLLGSEALYRHAFTGRRVVRAAPRAAISGGSFVMSMSLGLDLRSLVPPFFPVQRNADGLFGALLHAAFPGSFIGFLPWVVEHAPATPRSSPFPAFFASLGRTPSVDLIGLLVGAARVEADPAAPDRALRALGDALSRWAGLPPADFDEICRIQALRARSLDLSMLDAALVRHRGAPVFWARDVDRAATALRAALPSPRLGWPADLVDELGEETGRALFQQLCGSFGALLRVWPEIFAAAADLGRRRREGEAVVRKARP